MIRGLFLIVFVALATIPAGAIADHVKEILLNVRTVEAILDANSAGKSQIDPRIKDLAEKFANLDYNNFRLVTSQQISVPLMHKHSVRLSAGDTLTVRLHYRDDHQIGMWLKWVDPGGMQVLDTRMHFDPEDPVVAGVDRDAKSGMLLAIGLAR